MKSAIVVVAYNRKDSLVRLLKSLNEAKYGEAADTVLIISIDNSGKEDVVEEADKFVWKHGEKKVIRHENRLGLKAHIIECGEYSKEYGSIIMLEDDLYVSPYFYEFANKALEFTAEDKKVAGVSLYSHRFNVFARLPFEPVNDGYSNWYFQFASSWGQAWTFGQWRGFREWFEKHDGEDIEDDRLPSDITDWGENSWLKYADKYLVENNKYFFYPRLSYTTNFADEGEHAANPVTDLQVSLAEGEEAYRFSALTSSKSVYDAYFEYTCLEHDADLYGLKERDGNIKNRFFYGTKALGYRVVESYGLRLKPMEANIIHGIEGQDIFLYDTQNPGRAVKTDTGKLENYFYPGMNKEKIARLIRRRLSGK